MRRDLGLIRDSGSNFFERLSQAVESPCIIYELFAACVLGNKEWGLQIIVDEFISEGIYNIRVKYDTLNLSKRGSSEFFRE